MPQKWCQHVHWCGLQYLGLPLYVEWPVHVVLGAHGHLLIARQEGLSPVVAYVYKTVRNGWVFRWVSYGNQHWAPSTKRHLIAYPLFVE